MKDRKWKRKEQHNKAILMKYKEKERKRGKGRERKRKSNSIELLNQKFHEKYLTLIDSKIVVKRQIRFHKISNISQGYFS